VAHFIVLTVEEPQAVSINWLNWDGSYARSSVLVPSEMKDVMLLHWISRINVESINLETL
jgi:hypothetical protein